MSTYVREGRKRKWHIALEREAGGAVLAAARAALQGVRPKELTPTYCNRSIRALHITPDLADTVRTGVCYQCSRKENHG